jgi:hypothetical protein
MKVYCMQSGMSKAAAKRNNFSDDRCLKSPQTPL